MTPPRHPRAWQRMLSGRRLDLLDPNADDIAIEDIAHGLARVARWNGQTEGHHIYSVAQHSLLVETIFRASWPDSDRRGCLAALLHDAPEYVVGDLISPFKAVLGDRYRTVEHRILAAVHARFGIADGAAAHDRIKEADRAAARLEATLLAGFTDQEAGLFFGPPHPEAAQWHKLLEPERADVVQALFLSRFRNLMGSAEQ
jgi:uncharacterized protein